MAQSHSRKLLVPIDVILPLLDATDGGLLQALPPGADLCGGADRSEPTMLEYGARLLAISTVDAHT